MNYKISDFKKVNKLIMESHDGLFQLSKDKQGYIYPACWFYSYRNYVPVFPKENGNFWTYMVHISYDYSFTFEEALEVLNMVLNDTWKHGEGRYLNGLKSSYKLYNAITNFNKV